MPKYFPIVVKISNTEAESTRNLDKPTKTHTHTHTHTASPTHTAMNQKRTKKGELSQG